MADTPFELLPCRGTYFQLARYGHFSDLPDREFAEWLTREVGVAVIPVSVFYADGRDDRVVRFCFRQDSEETLVRAAVERLQRGLRL
jgi:methionine transaminase